MIWECCPVQARETVNNGAIINHFSIRFSNETFRAMRLGEFGLAKLLSSAVGIGSVPLSHVAIGIITTLCHVERVLQTH